MPDNTNKIVNQLLNFSKLTAKAVKKASRSISRKIERGDNPYRPKKTPYDTSLLPLAWPLPKRRPPWYVQWSKNPERISLVSVDTDEHALRFDLVKGCHGLASGAAFRANPNAWLPADAATLTYSVYIPEGFDFVKGGKLPGLNIGCAPNDCSTGGAWSDTGGSFRPMFRERGACIGYMYAPLPGAGQGTFDAQHEEYKAVAKVKGVTGIDLWHGKSGADLQLRSGAWNSISISVRLNTPGYPDGAVALTVNGRTKSMDGILWRLNEASRINAVNFVVFFGGGSAEWDSLVDTYMLFKDISFASA